MSTKPETTFYTSVHKHLPKDVYAVKMSNPYVGGIPDCWYSGIKGDLWVEYKFVVLPKRDGSWITIELSELQRQWLNNRAMEGRRVAVCVGCKEGGVLFVNGAWNNTITKTDFLDCLLSRKELATLITEYVA